LFNGLLAYLADQQKLDKDFIAQHVEGFDEALAAARTDSPEICDLPPADLETFYRWFAATAKTLTFYSQGINQSSAGTDKVNALLNCHLATGRVGKPGSGPLSLTGQPNAMGGREAGSLANALAAHMFFDDASIDRVGRFWAAAKMAAKPGLKTIDLFQAVEEGKIKALWIAATNPAVSLPDSHRVRKALAKCPFVVIADCENKTDAMPFAHVRLPALAWGEKDGMVTNSDRAISRQRGFMNPPGEARPDWWMWAELGKRLGHEQAFSYAEPSEIFQEFARLTAFENDGSRDLDLGGLIGRDYRAHSPIQWPVRKDGQGTARLSRFFTPNGKARCLPISFRPPVNLPSPEFPFILNTGRSRDHWHTQTRTGRSSRLAGHTPEPALFIHPEDAKRAELLEGGLAVVESPLGAIHVRVQCDPGQRLGELFIPIHWNDQVASNGVVSRLIATATDPISGQPESKHTPVRIRPLASLWTALILSRAEVSFGDGVFWSRSNGRNHHVYRLEGLTPIDDWHVQARAWLGEDREWVEMMDGRRSIFRAAALDDRRLGAILYVAPDAHNLATPWLAEAFDKPLLNIQERMAVLAGGPGGRPRGDRLICSCFAVPQSAILAGIEKHNLTSAAEIGKLLKAGTNCGSCLPEINALLAKKSGAA
jgi:assimilatory nitrate reductase catalytic subunit